MFSVPELLAVPKGLWHVAKGVVQLPKSISVFKEQLLRGKTHI
jgi:hypothetical protein